MMLGLDVEPDVWPKNAQNLLICLVTSMAEDPAQPSALWHHAVNAASSSIYSGENYKVQSIQMCPAKLNTSSCDKQPLFPVILHGGNLPLQIALQGQKGARLHERNMKNACAFFENIALWIFNQTTWFHVLHWTWRGRRDELVFRGSGIDAALSFLLSSLSTTRHVCELLNTSGLWRTAGSSKQNRLRTSHVRLRAHCHVLRSFALKAQTVLGWTALIVLCLAVHVDVCSFVRIHDSMWFYLRCAESFFPHFYRCWNISLKNI